MGTLPQISSDRLIKALERLGFTQRNGKGSHTVLRRYSTVVVVPHQNPVRRGTLRNVLKQAGITVQELLENL
ncbi:MULTISPECIES: type II toxin-antitoxin system HicA family toxin [Streptomyces]|uniref:Type II toxin-antitoxin system HicA family toxin n=1 Tax=Streptomyces lonegramiae TaxID=3075524 RepID=A0ABU2XPW5_9ACTN|nr:type II toxin-antitoxin system HicA family toxin [Streptomyces sp. DSM 41529]MDT0547969.1 type II toxin-antitoxin system HicA family toxin [Streptomyces sp. DSM 41529]